MSLDASSLEDGNLVLNRTFANNTSQHRESQLLMPMSISPMAAVIWKSSE